MGISLNCFFQIADGLGALPDGMQGDGNVIEHGCSHLIFDIKHRFCLPNNFQTFGSISSADQSLTAMA